MTQDAAQARKGAGLSVAAWPLGRKMALALAIPLLLAAVLGGLRVAGDYGDSRHAARSADQVTIIQPAVDYLTASEAAMVAAQSDDAASQGDLIDAISDISTNAETLIQARDEANLDELQTAHVNALLDLSQAMRGEGAETLGPATWIALVRQLESSVSQLVTSVNAAQETPEPRLEQLSQAMSGRLSLALQQGLIATTLSQSSSQELFSELGVEAAAIDRLAGSVDGAEEQTALLREQNTRHAGEIRDDAATDLDGRDAYVPYDEITETLVAGVTETLDTAAGAAQRNALVGAVLTLLALAAAIALAFFIARSLLGPIGKVRDGALAVARHRLPDAVARIRAGQEPEPIRTIDVHTNEEIGQVARAVDDLHRQAIHLASGEAQLRQTVNAMFVTLSRRSTSLVNQQLAQIERLEHDEEDPKRLESLFRLDHLASRMRRTADSLLILADAPNRAAGQFSLTVGEALQAATSGVQDYQRVQILSNLNTRVGDEAAADVVHLLTELVDNALSFSPPAEPVRLAAKQGPEGVTITITDAGLGVPPAELEQLNKDLQHGAEATPDTARRMGLFVVSRLAERHDIHTHLARNPGGGMTATILLPPSVLPDVPQTGAPVAPAAAEAAAAPTASSSDSTELVGAAAAPVLSKREARNRARAEKAEAKAAERAAATEAKAKAAKAAKADAAPEPVPATSGTTTSAGEAAEATPEAPAASTTALSSSASSSEPTADRLPLGSLLPRRDPGANMPRTGADAFLPPETSSASGPLFGKRADSTDATATSDAAGDAGATEHAEKVARVVPITALASRQRAQAAEEARSANGEQPATGTADEPAEDLAQDLAQDLAGQPADARAEQPAEQPARAHDPLSDPLPADAFDEPATTAPSETVAHEQVDEHDEVEQVEPEPVEPEAAPESATARVDDVEPDAGSETSFETRFETRFDAADPLGLGAPDREVEPAQPEPVSEVAAEVAAEPVADREPEARPEPELEPVPSYDATALLAEGHGLTNGTNGTNGHGTNGTNGHGSNGHGSNGHGSNGHGSNGHGSNGHGGNGLSHGSEPARAGGESPIFKSMRSGWLAGEGKGEWHETEVDRGWEIAEHVTEPAPVVESTPVGLPRRAPGERLVPGSVTPPTAAK
ncbi:MAG TPA: ATP-binding protein, partial [Nocardioides sp.]|nr:ATP-binding protein [Nocardioides sp.]